MQRCPPLLWFKGRADRPASQFQEASTMAGAAVGFAGNLTDQPEVR